jgi:hypothetical protein
MCIYVRRTTRSRIFCALHHNYVPNLKCRRIRKVFLDHKPLGNHAGHSLTGQGLKLAGLEMTLPCRAQISGTGFAYRSFSGSAPPGARRIPDACRFRHGPDGQRTGDGGKLCRHRRRCQDRQGSLRPSRGCPAGTCLADQDDDALHAFRSHAGGQGQQEDPHQGFKARSIDGALEARHQGRRKRFGRAGDPGACHQIRQ